MHKTFRKNLFHKQLLALRTNTDPPGGSARVQLSSMATSEHCTTVDETKCKTIFKNSFSTAMETQCSPTFDTSCDTTLDTAYKQDCKVTSRYILELPYALCISVPISQR